MTSTITTAPPTSTGGRRRGRAALLPIVVVVAAVATAVAAGSSPGASKVVATPRAEAAADAVAPVISVDGLVDGDRLSAEELTTARVAVSVGRAPADSLEVSLDGEPVASAGPVVTLDGGTLATLDEGDHELLVAAGIDKPGTRTATEAIAFSIDRTPPSIELPDTVTSDGLRAPLTLEFTVRDAVAVTAGDAEVTVTGDSVTASFASTPREVVVTAVDRAGNTAVAEVPVVVSFPFGRAVHTTPSAWRYEPKRTPILEMLEAGLIDAVQIDVKDELGDVGWDTDVELADAAGAEDFNRNFDMAAAVEQIHSYGARVIGRLVVYRDSRLATWAWRNGRPDMVIQATDGTPYEGRYGDYAFTNFANPDVQQYNLDIALEAADIGFDDVLYDYIRRPDGAIEDLVIPGLGDRSPEEAVVEVMATAYPLLRERGVWVGASVFGIAIDRPTQMAQHIPSMVPHVDYIAPMVYPNHWNLGEYRVAVPEEAPYEIVERSVTLYRDALEGTDTALVPWLQDFGGYGEAEVRAQIDATEAVTGERSFLLWASSATYTRAALDPIPDRSG